MAKTPEHYRRLQYNRRVRPEIDEDGSVFFVAFITELPGVEGVGDSLIEARAELGSAFEDYISAMIEWGEDIPEPQQWPESLGWPGDAPGAEAGSVTVVALEGVDIGASPAKAIASGAVVFDVLRVGEEADLHLGTVAA